MSNVHKKSKPNAVDVERYIIGAILDSPQALQKVYDSELSTEHFYVIGGKNALIFSSILELREQGKPIDLVTLTEHMQTSGLGKHFGAGDKDIPSYLDKCMDDCPQSENVLEYINIVKDKAQRRLFIENSDRIKTLLERADKETESIDGLKTEIELVVGDIVSGADNIKPFQKKEDLFKVWTHSDIIKSETPKRDYILDGYLPRGLVLLLAGKSKIGKSWLSLNLHIAVSCGGKWLGKDVAKGESLYLALEDDEIRMKDRMNQLCPNKTLSGNFTVFDCPKLSSGGLRYLTDFAKLHPELHLVIIDTLQKFRDNVNARSNYYQEDYEQIGLIKKFAKEFNICVILVTHLRKAVSFDSDPMDQVLGSTGLTGAIDNVLILNKERTSPNGILFKSGRELKEERVALSFDFQSGIWSGLGEASEYIQNTMATKIIDILKENKAPMTNKDIALELEITTNLANITLLRMKRKGMIKQEKRGIYTL